MKKGIIKTPMDIRNIKNTTKRFYKEISDEFSNTRQYPWKGWGKILDNIKTEGDVNILDLGCGNGRFYEFLKNNLKVSFKYLGLDNNEELLNIAKGKYPKASFNTLDIFDSIEDIKKTYDLVVGFGITHHIPGKEFRIKWFEDITKLINKNGYLVLSFWNFLGKGSLIKARELEENDYWMGWGNSKEKRYCHYYDKKELEEITKILKKNNVLLIKNISDATDLNIYKIYKYN